MQVARGVTRHVFLIGGIAVKIPNPTNWKMFLCGLQGNMQEADFWEMRLDGMCPVLFSLPLGFLNVMKRVTILSESEFLQFDVELWRARYGNLIPVESKRDSFGWLDGNVVAVDYGDQLHG